MTTYSFNSEVDASHAETLCGEMSRRGCCLESLVRVGFSAQKQRVYQTWVCDHDEASAFVGQSEGDHQQKRSPQSLPLIDRTRRVRSYSTEATTAIPLEAMVTTSRWNLDRIDRRQHFPDNQYRPHPILATEPTTVHVYVVDTGVLPGHQEFSGMTVAMDYPSAAGASDCNGHGTHVASLIASQTTGVVYEAKSRIVLHAVRVLDCSGSGTTTTVINGLAWVVNHLQRPAIINLSLGGPKSTVLDSFVNAIRFETGVLVVTAAGNENTDACTRSPASANGALAVGAIRYGDVRASYSNYGPCVNLFAPGSDIVGASAMGSGSYVIMSGTSMACPHVTGALVRLLLNGTSEEPDVLWDALASRVTPGQIVGVGPGSPNKLLFVGVLDTATSPAPGPAPPFPLPAPPPWGGAHPNKGSSTNSNVFFSTEGWNLLSYGLFVLFVIIM
jgi:hypothetical protein